MIRIDDSRQLRGALQRMRAGAGLTQRALGARACISQATISHIERGKQGITVHTLVSLARAAGYDLALIPREDRP